MLLRTPGFAAASIVCLALGIGATTAIFSIVNAVLLRPLPYAQPDRLVRIYTEFPNAPASSAHRFWFSPPEFLDLRKDTTSFATLDGWVNGGANLTGGTEPIRVTASFISGGMLTTLGVSPIRGRLLNDRDDLPTAPTTAVMSYGLWQRAFGGDPGVLNRDLQFNGVKCTIVGIMPKGFQFPPGETDPPEIWANLQIDPANPGNRGGHFLYLLGRLKPGVSIEHARSEMDQLVAHYGATRATMVHAFDPKKPTPHTISMYPFHDEVVGSVRPALLVLLGAVVFVLLIACVNVANLLLARAEARQREIAVRKALGAGLGRLVRQFVTEGIILSLAGAGLGLLLAFAGVRFIAATSAASVPRSNELGVNTGVLLFTISLSLVTGLAFGLAPLAQIIAKNVHDTLKAAASRTTATIASNRFRQALVVSELALALILLICTGLMIRAFWKLQQVDTGLNARGVLTMQLALPGAVYTDYHRIDQFWTTLQQRVSTMPGVASASMANGLPPIRRVNANTTPIEGFVPRPGLQFPNIDFYNVVAARYFETMGIRLIEGRLFDDRDGENAPLVVVVNQTLARTYWPTESALGHRIKPGGSKDFATVVGIVGDVKNTGLEKATGTELYIPLLQYPTRSASLAYLVVRSTSDPSPLVTPIRNAIHTIDPSLPISNVRTMEDAVLAAQSRPRFLALLLTLFATVALVLAAVGIYGVISYSVAQRTNEFGIRIAMGASSSNVLGMVLGQGARIALIGFAIGAGFAFWLTRFMASMLFEVSAFDPLTFIAMVFVLGAVTLFACFVPARRATKVDPMVALRYE
jgi:putative ABC transport system permease protein